MFLLTDICSIKISVTSKTEWEEGFEQVKVSNQMQSNLVYILNIEMHRLLLPKINVTENYL